MKIFISSTFDDLREHRVAVRDAILRWGHHPVGMEDFGAEPVPPADGVLARLDECQALVGIYAHRYGSRFEGQSISATEAELDRAEARRIPCFCYRVDPNYPWIPLFIDGGEDQASLRRFLARVDRLLRSTFTDPKDLATKVAADLARSFPTVAAPGKPTSRQLWHVPHPPDRYFTGREQELHRLSELDEPRGQGVTLVAITGLGGSGKTELAVQYAYRFRDRHDVCVWIRAAEPQLIAEDYSRVAFNAGLVPDGSTDQAAAIAAARAWFEHENGWLLIFDNAHTVADVKPYLPASGRGFVILTSRNPNWRAIGDILPLSGLSVADAAKMIVDRAGAGDAPSAQDLAVELGGLPLALVQAGAYIEQTQTSIAEYLHRFRDRRAELMARGGEPDNPTVRASWELSFVTLARESPAGEALLNLCAFLAPEDIPYQLIRSAADDLPEPLTSAAADDVSFDAMVAAVRRSSLASTHGAALLIHRLVQAATRDRLDPDSRRLWCELAVSLIDDAFPRDSDQVRTWPTLALLLPHAIVACRHAELGAVAADACAQLLNKIGLYLDARGDWAEARKTLQRALAVHERAFGPDDLEIATFLINLGNVEQALDAPAAALDLFTRALRIVRRAHDEPHDDVAVALNNLGLVHQQMSDWPRARAYFEEALSINLQVHGPVSSEVARVCNNMGLVIGEPRAALEWFERALAVDEQLLAANDPQIAIDLFNIGYARRDLRELDAAKAAFRRALDIDEAAYGPSHPEVSEDRRALAALLDEIGEHDSAAELRTRADAPSSSGLRLHPGHAGAQRPNV